MDMLLLFWHNAEFFILRTDLQASLIHFYHTKPVGNPQLERNCPYSSSKCPESNTIVW